MLLRLQGIQLLSTALLVAAVVGCAVASGRAAAMEPGVYEPPDLDRFLLITSEDADGDGDGAKETHIRHYRSASGDKVFSMTTVERLWAWSMQTHGQERAGSGWNYVLRDSDCDGVFDERYTLDEEFHVPPCLE